MEFCRLCDSETKPDSYEHIFNGNVDPPIWRMIANLANLTISEDDPYTKLVCFQCFDQLQNFHVFRKKVLYTDWRIRHIRSKNNNNDTERYCPLIKTEHEEEIINVEEHSLKIENDTDKDHHTSMENDNSNKTVIVDDLNQTNNIKEHKTCTDSTGNKTNKDENGKYCIEKETVEDEDSMDLDYSSTETETPNNIETTRNSKNQRYQCEKCSKTLANKNSLRNHVKLHAASREYYPCDICGYDFKSKRILEGHLRTNSIERHCEVCDKTFPARCLYRLHLKDHLLQSPDNTKTQPNERRYKCVDCPMTFIFHSQFVRHSRTHSGKKPFKCTMCDREFAAKNSLKIHLQTHTGEKPHQCDMCGQTFTLLHNLKTHVERVHTKLHECKVCKKTFMNRLILRTHSKEHSRK